jgi:carbon storage regulator
VWQSGAGSCRGCGDNQEARSNIEGMAMLVLSRKKNESIVINNDITIVVVEIRGDKVRLGVEAPKEIPVHRREVYDAIRRNEMTIGDKADTDTNGAVGDT